MYRDKYNVKGRHSNTPESQLHDRCSARRATQKRKQRKQKILVVNLAIIIVIIIIISIFLIKTNDNEVPDNIKGTWVYNQYVQYEFDGHGNGCMCLEDTHYEYAYEIKKDTLCLDFENKAVHDCVYTFTIEGSQLTIVGGEGTTGGTYILSKSLQE